MGPRLRCWGGPASPYGVQANILAFLMEIALSIVGGAASAVASVARIG
jgi:hypothetical protein